ncbi:MauE/DoxX family redox-associated membrane protein [Spirillospora sp. NBC_01491]|uniref:MauE/DoxX family redox-associated membrane protein n=1 Tax=Spirillospora sp. NBC_01491 TaxID=2976007 RepID=UPI002E2EF6FE|nr:MauE/DoxX family redox-associated membrane protein [Spirillospora sp. NBC_01491]
MTGLLAGIAAVTVPLVLLGSLYGQLRRPGALAAAVRAHRTVPGVLAAPVAGLAVAAEALTGFGAAAGLLLWENGLLRGALAASAALLALYAAYAAYVARTRPRGVPCGCAGDAGTPMTGWVAVRAAALAGLAAAGAARGLQTGPPAAEVAVAVLAGLGFAVILWSLPQAMIEEGAR